MKSLFRLIRQNRIWVIFSLLVTFISIGTQLTWTLYIGKLADSIVERTGVVVTFITTMSTLLIGNGFLQYVNQYVNRYTSERMAHTLRMNFADSLLADNSFTADIAGYEAMSKVQNELMQASEYMSNTLFDIVGMTLSGLFALFFLTFQNALLTVVILIPMIIVVLFTRLLSRKLVPLAHQSLDKKVEHNKIAYSMISNSDTVFLFDAKPFFKEKYENALDEWATVETRKERVSAVCNSLSGILSQIPLLILFATGSLMIWKGYMTIGMLIIFLNMIKSLLQTLMNLPSWMVSIKNFLVHLTRADI